VLRVFAADHRFFKVAHAPHGFLAQPVPKVFRVYICKAFGQKSTDQGYGVRGPLIKKHHCSRQSAVNGASVGIQPPMHHDDGGFSGTAELIGPVSRIRVNLPARSRLMFVHITVVKAQSGPLSNRYLLL
jgi:hypothetical protein